MKLVVPIKRFASAKQRLAGQLSADCRSRLSEAMAHTVLSELSEVQNVEKIYIASSEPQISPIAVQYGFEVIPDPPSSGLNQTIENALNYPGIFGTRDIGIVFADLPLFNARDFDLLIGSHNAAGDRCMTIVSDRGNDGTNILLCRPGAVLRPAYGKRSAYRYSLQAQSENLSFNCLVHPTLSLDLDVEEDLIELIKVARQADLLDLSVLNVLKSQVGDIQVGGVRCS